jgi:hypothetical protein
MTSVRLPSRLMRLRGQGGATLCLRLQAAASARPRTAEDMLNRQASWQGDVICLGGMPGIEFACFHEHPHAGWPTWPYRSPSWSRARMSA